MSRTIVILWLAACGMMGLAQQPSFDVAAVRPNSAGPGGGIAWDFLPGGRLTARNVPIVFIIEQVYQVRSFQIAGDPSVMAMIRFGSGGYDIEATGAPSASRDQLKEMVKTLLSDRFKLKLHKETRELSVYALIPAKNGLKLQPTKNADGLSDQAESVMGWMDGTNDSADALAGVLGERVDRPVLNKTGVNFAFDFRLTFTPDSATPAAEPADGGNCPQWMITRAANLGIKEPLSCPSIFTAVQDQLGLKLDPQKAPVDVLVIDHVEPPSAN